ncbi:MAG: type II secretion system F family protein [Acidobacteriota bacterium]
MLRSLDPAGPRRLSASYRTLSRLLSAGLSRLDAAVSLEGGNAVDRELAAAMRSDQPWTSSSLLPPEHLATLRAGEQHGRLDAVLLELAEDGDLLAQSRSKLLKKLLYPAILFTAAFVIPPIPLLLTGGVGAYLRTALPVPGTLFVLVLIFDRWITSPGRDESILHRLPLLSPVFRLGAQVRFHRSFSRLVGAGLDLRESLRTAAAAAGPNPVGATALEVDRDVHLGRSVGESLARRRLVPPILAAVVTTADQTGRYDQASAQVALQLGDELEQAIDTRTRLFAGAAYLIAAGLAARSIFGFYGQLYR